MMAMSTLSPNSRLGWLLLAALAAGCGRAGEPWGAVTGRVTFDEAPAPHMVVLYSLPERGIEMTAVTDASGDFRITTAQVAGLPVGEYRVAIYPAVYETPKDGMMFDAPAVKKASRVFPEIYRDTKTSGLTATVTTGNNHAEFRLKGKP